MRAGRPLPRARLRSNRTRRTFALEYWRDAGWYVGKLREVPGVFSQGRTLRELERNVREAYQLMLEDNDPSCRGTRVKEIGVEV